MKPRKREPRPPVAEREAALDSELEAALKRVLEVVYKEHPLEANQLLTLAAEIQKLGVHRLVEEHLRKFRRRQAASD